MARLEVYVGPVASCKTAMLHREMLTYYGRGYSVCIVSSTETPEKDTPLNTNQGIELSIPRGVGKIRATLLSELHLNESFINSTIICVDEAQFFTDLVESVRYMLTLYPKKVFIIAGLDAWAVGDYRPSTVIALCAYASSFTKLLAGCDDCTRESEEVVPPNACYSYCIDKSLTKTVSLGGKDKFLALCPKHYYARVKK